MRSPETRYVPFRAAVQSTAPQSVSTGVFTAEQVKRGEATYARECSTCHGERMNGGEGAPSLNGADFAAKWVGQSVGDLLERISQTMPAPPEQPGKLTMQQYVDIVAIRTPVPGPGRSRDEWPTGRWRRGSRIRDSAANSRTIRGSPKRRSQR